VYIRALSSEQREGRDSNRLQKKHSSENLILSSNSEMRRSFRLKKRLKSAEVTLRAESGELKLTMISEHCEKTGLARHESNPDRSLGQCIIR